MAEEKDLRLKQYIDSIERLEEEKREVGKQIKEVYGDAKSSGFDPKVMRALIKLRTMKPQDVDEHEMLLETYKRALGMEE